MLVQIESRGGKLLHFAGLNESIGYFYGSYSFIVVDFS
jgi:hypothetical protein